jgi:NADPH:quinone reductase-like Zn-dependent oxidoreductase
MHATRIPETGGPEVLRLDEIPAPEPAKAALARDAGAEHVVLYSQEDFVAGVQQATNGAGVYVVYDGVGSTAFEKGLDCLRPRGMMVLSGAASGPVPPFDLAQLNTGDRACSEITARSPRPRSARRSRS